MTCRALYNNASDESFHSDVLTEIDLMYSNKNSENKELNVSSVMGKLSEDERGENWIKCFSCPLWAHLDCTTSENVVYNSDFYK